MAADNTVQLNIVATGEEQLRAAIARAKADAAGFGTSLSSSTKTAAEGAKILSDAVGNTTTQVDALTRSTGRARDASGRFVAGARDAATATDKVGDAADRAGGKLDQLKGKFEKLRNFGGGMALAGGGGLVAGEMFSRASLEGGNAGAMMADMLRKRGEGDRVAEAQAFVDQTAEAIAAPDDDPINRAVAKLGSFGMTLDQLKPLMQGFAGQARVMGYELEGVAEQAGKAFAKGDAQQLIRSGVTFSEEQRAELEQLATSGASLADKQQAILRILGESFRDYAFRATEGMSDAQIAANRFALTWDKTTENIGAGVNDVKGFFGGIAGSVLKFTNESTPGLERTAGSVFYLGSALVTTTGTTLAFVGQAGLGVTALRSLDIAQIKASISARLNAGAQAQQAAGITATGGAANVTAGRLGTMASLGSASTATLSTASFGAVAAVTAIGVAAGVAGGAIFRAFGESAGWFDEQQTMLEGLESGWAHLTDTIAGTGNVMALALNQNASDLQGVLDDIETKFNRLVTDKKLSPEEAEEQKKSAKVAELERFEKQARADADRLRRAPGGNMSPFGPLSTYLSPLGGAAALFSGQFSTSNDQLAKEQDKQANEYRKQINALTAGASGGEDVAGAFDSEMGESAGFFDEDSSAAVEAIQANIERVQEELRQAKGKSNIARRDALNAELRGLKKQLKETKKQESLFKKHRQMEAEIQGMEAKAEFDIQADRFKESLASLDRAEKRYFDRKIKTLDKLEKTGLLSSDEKSDVAERLRAKYEREKILRDANNEYRREQLEADGIRAEADAEASGKEGDERAAILKKGQVRADTKMRIAAGRLQAARREVNEMGSFDASSSGAADMSMIRDFLRGGGTLAGLQKTGKGETVSPERQRFLDSLAAGGNYTAKVAGAQSHADGRVTVQFEPLTIRPRRSEMERHTRMVR